MEAQIPKRVRSSLMKRDPALFMALVTVWLSFAVFIFLPFLRLLGATFVVDGKPSFANVKTVLSKAYNVKALYGSLILATAVSITGTVVGYLFALAVTRTRISKVTKGIIGAVAMLPLISPPFTSSISLTLALGPNGMLLKALGIGDFSIYGFLGTWISETLTYFPVAFMVIAAVLNTMSATLDDAALSLGASRWRMFRTLTIPLSLPAIVNSILLLFGASLADFATPLILGGHAFPVLPTEAYLLITGMFDLKGGATMSFLLLVPALLVFFLQRMMLGKKSFVSVTGKSGSRTEFARLPQSLNVVIAVVCLIVVAFIIYLYAIILWGSLVKVWSVNNTPTLEHYRYVFKHGQKAIKDTVLIAIISTVIGSLLAVVIGFMIQRKEFVGRRLLEFSSMLNYALPGTVVGIAYIIAFNTKPLVLTGTLSILVAAYVFRYYATGIRSVIASLEQIDPALEEASLSLGAGTVRTFTHITVPLIIPALISGMRYLFIHCMTAISATIFLVSVRWTLLTTRILESMTELQFSQASAFSIVLIAIVFLADFILKHVLKFTTAHITRSQEISYEQIGA
ncbi:MAG TPA: iron ABC transporter permease [Sphaerochaeta sp.]|nr:iron ABC transporter permease [Sphaerochaeta sp.]HQB05078.1 iron ABC transporter permease [Sphaerochaeta sp.]